LLGFHTDGDWVAQDKTGKLRWLMQGADERVTGPGKSDGYFRPPLLFMGMINHGQKRASHIAELKARYGVLLEILGDGGPMRRIHGRALADYLTGRIVIAPDGPDTDRYWSNRIYQVLGFGGYLLHPYHPFLLEHYRNNELVYYRSREECNQLIDYYSNPQKFIWEESRNPTAKRGYERTIEEHLYRHRCEELVSIVQERLSSISPKGRDGNP